MKKYLLLVFVLFIGVSLLAQNTYEPKLMSTKYEAKYIPEPVGKKDVTITSSMNDRVAFTKHVKGRDLTFVPMGAAGNAYGFYGGPRTYMWADPRINSVSFIHRMTADPDTYGNSRMSYDVSTDRGATWSTNIQVYEPLGPGSPYPEAAGRYPQGGILNFPGNTDPANAYFSYFIPVIDNSNGTGIWGGFAYGSNPLLAVDPPTPTQTNVTTGNGYYRLIPDAYTVTLDGHVWCVDGNFEEEGGAYTFLGEYIINHGVWDDGAGDIVYEEYLLEVLGEGDGINDSKIAFAPDGQTGYICVMSDSESDPQDFNGYHPVLYKTEDGGESWDGPIHVLLGGYDGIEAIKYYWDDEVIEAIDEYAAGFDRDEVYYNMGFHVDMIVDENGNPHLTGIISIAVPDGWYPNEFFMATWHVWSEDGAETFDAYPLYNNRFFEGDLGGISEFNRPQLSTTTNGRYMFFSCIDTDFEGIEENTQPDIYCAAYDLLWDTHTEMTNITEFTQAWLVAWMASQSHYVFVDVSWPNIDITVPFVYTELDPADPGAEVGFWYVDGWTYTYTMPTDIESIQAGSLQVSHNIPNPFTNSTVVNVDLEQSTTLTMDVYNLMGQRVMDIDAGYVNAGKHELTIDGSQLKSGVYFYTVKAGDQVVTKRMVKQ